MTTMAPAKYDDQHSDALARRAPAMSAMLPGVLLMSSSLMFGAPGPIFFSTSTPSSYVMPALAIAGGRPATHSTDHTAAAPLAVAEQVEALRKFSGLTTDQVGRLMGVSRRSVHNWLGGAAMSRINEERLSRLLDVVRGIPGDPSRRRAYLLDNSAGRSLFHRLLDERVEQVQIQANPLSVRERIDQ